MTGTPAAGPSAPTALTVTPGAGRLNVAFTPPADGGSPITGYEYSLDDGTTWIAPSSAITSSPFTITGLAGGTTYEVSVRAANAIDVGAPSATVTAATTQSGAPTGVTVNPRPGALEVEFTPPADDEDPVTHYEYSLDGGTTWIAPSSAITSSPFTISGLTDGTATSVLLRTRSDSVTPGSPSASVTGTPGPAPSAPGSVTITPGVGQLEVAFTEPTVIGNPVTDYEYTLDGGVTWESLTQESSDPSAPFTITGLTDATEYQVRVRAVNAVGGGTPSAEFTATTAPRPLVAAPTGVTVTPGPGTLTVGFTPPSGVRGTITGYQYSLDGGDNWASPSSSVTSSPFTISGLTDGTPESILLRALEDDVPGTPSASVTGTPGPAPSAPGSVTITPGVGQLEVAFTEPTVIGNPVTGYEYTLDGGVTWIAVTQSSPTSPLLITGLASGTSYAVSIRAVSAAGAGDPSQAVTVVTQVAPPPTVVPGRPLPLAPAPSDASGTGAPVTVVPVPVVRGPVRGSVPNVPVLAGGAAPRPTDSPVVRVGGVPVTPAVAPTGSSRQVAGATISTGTSVVVGSIGLIIETSPGGGEVRTEAGAAPQLSVVRDRPARLSGGGLAPGSELRVWLPLDGSDARSVAALRVGRDGTFEEELLLGTRPDRGAGGMPFPVGLHVLQLVGVAADGELTVIEQTLRIRQPDPEPEPGPSADGLPRAQVGEAFATNAGSPETIRVTPDSDARSALVEGEGWNVALRLGTESGAVAPSDLGGARVEIIVDETAEVSGEGFLPGTRADVWLFSEPVLLGSYSVGIDGTFRGDAKVAGVPLGEHTLQLQGIGEDGYTRSTNLGIIVGARPTLVAAAPSETVVLTATTEPSVARSWFGLLVGLVLLILTRRRWERWWLLLARRRDEKIDEGDGAEIIPLRSHRRSGPPNTTLDIDQLVDV